MSSGSTGCVSFAATSIHVLPLYINVLDDLSPVVSNTCSKCFPRPDLIFRGIETAKPWTAPESADQAKQRRIEKRKEAMMEWLKGFDLSLWWHQLIVVGVAVLGTAIASHERGLIFIALGMVACGFGESRNHTKFIQLIDASAYRPAGMLTGYPRINVPLGIMLVGAGAMLIALGFFHLVVA
jgi:hypothetical protein